MLNFKKKLVSQETCIAYIFFVLSLVFLVNNIFLQTAQAAFSNLQVEVVSHSSVRIGVNTGATGNYYVQYGLTTNYGLISAPFSAGGSPAHIVANLSGMSAGTLYNFRICPEGSTNASLCSSNSTFTTASTSVFGPQLPTPPQTFSTAMPTINGQTFTVASDCSDLDAKLALAASQDGSKNHLVQIPAGTICEGGILFPAKASGSGVIVIGSDRMNSLPSSGQRVSPSDASYMPKILQNSVRSEQSDALPGSCTNGHLYWLTTNSQQNKYYVCGSSNNWNLVSQSAGYAQGTMVPSGACNAGAYFFSTSIPDSRYALYRCSDIFNKYIKINPRGDGGFAMAPATSGVSGYRLVGLEFVNMDSYNYPSSFFSIGGNYTTNHSNIVVDRCYFHTQTVTTSSINSAVGLNGSYVAVVDSYIDIRNSDFNSQQPINITWGSGPFKVSNNFIRGSGILLFVNDNDATVPRSDFEITRNTFSYKPEFMGGDGISHDVRGPVEFKRGTRILMEGNIFETYWSTLSGGNAIIITPRASNSTGFDNNSYQISDVIIRSNIFRNGSGGILVTGQDDVGYRNTKLTQRVLVENNLFYNIDAYTWAASWYGPTRGQMLALAIGAEDVVVRHNTFYKPRGSAPAIIHFSYGAVAGLDVRDNIFWVANDDLGLGGSGIRWSEPTLMPNGSSSVGKKGLAVLNAAALPSYSFVNNVIPSSIAGWTASNQSLFPPNNFYPGDLAVADTAIAFTDPSGGNFTLQSSSLYKNAGSDGTDPGVNMTTLYASIAGSTGSVPVIDSTPPSVPSGLSATAVSSGRVNLSWLASTDNVGVTGYKVYRAGSLLGTATSTTFSDLSVSPSTNYSYTVLAIDAAGNQSAQSTATTVTTPSAVDTVAPIISALTSAGVGQSAATVSWQTNEPTTGDLYYGPVSTPYFQLVTKTTLASSFVSNLSGLTSNTLYQYYVVARDASGNSATSTPQTFTTLANTIDTTPPVISAVAAKPNKKVLVISWTTNEPATTQVEYGFSNSLGTLTPLVSVLSNSHSVSIKNLLPNTTYYFKVFSKDSAGNLAISNIYSILTKQGQTILPDGVVAGDTVKFAGDQTIYVAQEDGLYGFDTYQSYQEYVATQPAQATVKEQPTLEAEVKEELVAQEILAREVLEQTLTQTTQPQNTSNKFATGSLVNDQGTIYLIIGTTKVPFTNFPAFHGLGYKVNRVLNADTSGYALAQTYQITAPNEEHPWSSWLILGKTIYYATQGGMVPVPSMVVFTANGGNLENVLLMNQADQIVLANRVLTPMIFNDERIVR